MAKIKFTAALERFFPDLSELTVHGNSVREILHAVEIKYPGISDYLLEEDGSLRKHVNIFLDENMIQDRHELSDEVGEKNEILVFQALSGG